MKKNKLNSIIYIFVTLCILAVATLIGYLFREFGFQESNVVVIYIFSVFIISRYAKGYLYGIISSLISVLLFNWFFTEPYFTFKVVDLTYLFTFVIMIITSIFTSTLTRKVIKSAEEAKIRENESKVLYQVINLLSDAESIENIGEIIAKIAKDVLNYEIAFIFFNEHGEPEKNYLYCKEDGTVIRRELYNTNELKERLTNFHESVDIIDNNYLYPIYGKSNILALLCVPNIEEFVITPSQKRILYSIIENTGLSLDRLRSLEEQVKSREETTQERYRSNLLRAISHDIRTPLSAMIGTSEILMSEIKEKNELYDLASDINKDALWLHGLVDNILNLTKLTDGKLVLNKHPEVIEEVIGVALNAIEKRVQNRTIDIFMPDKLIIASIDAKLISQVIINLLDNAIKHTPVTNEISISVKEVNKNVVISVADRGSGINEADLPHIFKTFYTSYNKIPDAQRGVGLGLAICQSIVEAHGGSIIAENRNDGGAVFTFTIPQGGNENGK